MYKCPLPLYLLLLGVHFLLLGLDLGGQGDLGGGLHILGVLHARKIVVQSRSVTQQRILGLVLCDRERFWLCCRQCRLPKFFRSSISPQVRIFRSSRNLDKLSHFIFVTSQVSKFRPLLRHSATRFFERIKRPFFHRFGL